MSTPIENNTAALNALLEKANALPNAGGGVVEAVIEELTITENGIYTAPDGVDGYSPVNVNVPIPDGYIKPSGTLNITQNGEYDVTAKSAVVVSVDAPEPALQEKTVTPTASSQAVTPDSGYDGLSKVTVSGDANLIPENIVSGKSIFGIVGSAESGGGAPVHVEEKDVNFWDYDGTLLYSYTLAEAQAMTELPPLPTREGLICQGWNWTLEQIKSFGLQVDVGAVYITDDGKTRIKIDVSTMLISNVTLNFGDANDDTLTVNIDWGDGSAIETVSGRTAQQYTHQYAATGIYTIALEVVRGTLRLGGSDATRPLIGGSANDATRCAIEINLGSNISAGVGYLSLQYSRKLRYITIPEGVTSIGAGVLSYTDALAALVVPATLTLTGSVASVNAMKVISYPWGMKDIGSLNGAGALRRLVLPPNITTLGNYTGQAARITVLHLPASLATIKNNCFNSNKYLAEIYCHSPTPPTLGNTTMLDNAADYLKIYVPRGSLEAYQTATNWSTAADRMEERDL